MGDDTIVFVADPTFGDILNFNVGATVDLEVPRRFWWVVLRVIIFFYS